MEILMLRSVASLFTLSLALTSLACSTPSDEGDAVASESELSTPVDATSSLSCPADVSAHFEDIELSSGFAARDLDARLMDAPPDFQGTLL
jgi:hypothetical protein